MVFSKFCILTDPKEGEGLGEASGCAGQLTILFLLLFLVSFYGFLSDRYPAYSNLPSNQKTYIYIYIYIYIYMASLMAQIVKNLPRMQETQV